MTQRESGVGAGGAGPALRLRSGAMALPEDRQEPDRGAAAAGGDSLWRQCCRRGGHWAGPP
ncbi:MAG: hypothetical protein ACLR0P_06045 [Oscillospiraceae bacterium]